MLIGYLRTQSLHALVNIVCIRALIGSSFVNELVGALTAMTAMWHDVFVWWERSAVQPAHACHSAAAGCLRVDRSVPWPLVHCLLTFQARGSCFSLTAVRFEPEKSVCVRSNQGQALFSVLSPSGLTSCSVWSGFLGNEIGYAGQELEKQSLYRQLVVWLWSESLHVLFLFSLRQSLLCQEEHVFKMRNVLCSALASNVFLCEMYMFLYMVVFFFG